MTPADTIFSIVLPVYNRASLIGKAIQSILDQTMDAYEIIVVDDGSTDTTRQEVMKFTDSRIRYFYKQNEERSIARNFGIAQAGGQYINFLDSDDFFLPSHLQIAYSALRDQNFPEILHVGYQIENFQGKVILTRAQFNDSINRKLIDDNALQCNSIFIRRLVLQELPFLQNPHAVLSEDWYLWLRLAARYKIHYVNIVTNVVCEHEQRSVNHLVPGKAERSILLILEALEADPVFMKYYGRHYYRFKARKFCFIALTYIIHGNKPVARRYLASALKNYAGILFNKSFLAISKKIVLQ